MIKEETQIMKGVAILLMIFYHLFDQLDVDNQLHNLLYIGNVPLCYILSKASNPVSFFLFLGGYGLYKVNERGDRHKFSRVLRLYIHYWLTLVVFVTIGYFIKPDIYPGGGITILYNFTGFFTTYNITMWFLLPYVILSLLAPAIFRIMSKFKAFPIIIFTLIIHIGTSFCISRYGDKYLFTNLWLYTPLLVIHLLFSFSLGVLAARQHYFERLREFARTFKYSDIIAWGGVITLVLISCVFRYNFFYAALLISCLYLCNIKGTFRRVLINLGNQSMNMWMIHGWFCYNLFREFTYSFRYPGCIMLFLVIISYACSLVINIIAKPIESRIIPMSIIKAKPML